MKRMPLVMAVVAGLGLLAAAILEARNGGSSAGPRRAAIPVVAHEEAGTIAAEGRVATYPGFEVKVGAERSGLVKVVSVRPGDIVPKGAILARIDTDETEAQIREVKARIIEAGADLRLARLNQARRDDLLERGVASTQEADQAHRDADAAAARLDALQAQEQRLGILIAKSRIVAPIAGTVVTRFADAGEILESGDLVATLADMNRVRIEAEADESDAGALTVGAPVAIRADAYPGRTWKGHVEEVPTWVEARRIDPRDPSRLSDTGIIPVKVALDETLPLKLGTRVEVAISRHPDVAAR